MNATKRNGRWIGAATAPLGARASLKLAACLLVCAGSLVVSAPAAAQTEVREETQIDLSWTAVTAEALPEISIAAEAAPALGFFREGRHAEVTFTLSRTGAVAEALTVAVSVSETRSFISGTPDSMATFDVGSSAATLTVSIDDDSVGENDGMITAEVVAAGGYKVNAAAGSATVKVRDTDDFRGTFTLERTSWTVEESAGRTSAEIVVNLEEGVSPFEMKVTLSTKADTAGSGVDFEALSELVEMVESDFALESGLWVGRRQVPVELIDDNLHEGPETFTLTLQRTAGLIGAVHLDPDIGPCDCATVTIADDDAAPELALTVLPRDIDEGETATVQVASTNGSAFVEDRTIALELGGTASAADYTIADGEGTALTAPYELVLAAGATAVEASITAVDDTEDDDGETILVTARHDGAVIGAQQTVTITAAGDPAMAPGAPTGLAATANGETRIDLTWMAPVDGGGAAISGYRIEWSRDGNVPWTVLAHDTMSAGTVYPDTGLAPATTRYYRVSAINSAGAGSASNVAGATTEALPEISIAAEAAPALGFFREGRHAEVTFTLSRTGAVAEALTVAVSVSETRSFISGTPDSMATFDVGSSAATLTVSIDDDSVGENDGMITAEVVAAGGYKVNAAAGSATVEVRDTDDFRGTFTLERTSWTVEESAGRTSAEIVVNLEEGVSPFEMKVTLSTKADTAGSGVDFEALSELVEMVESDFALESGLWVGRRQVPVELIDDNLHEGPETFTLTLQRTAGLIGAVHLDPDIGPCDCATVTIADDDAAPELALTVLPRDIDEGETATVQVASTNGSAFVEDRTIALELGGTASAADYTIADGEGTVLTAPYELVLAAGATAVEASITAVDDTEDDDGETILVTARHDGAVIGAQQTVTITGQAVSGELLTAAFKELPAFHHGRTFTLRVAFSEEIGISYKTFRDHSFAVRGGAVKRARRVGGRHDLWEVAIKPASSAAVTIVLAGNRPCGLAGAVCGRADTGKQLSNTLAHRVPGPLGPRAPGRPALSVTDARGAEDKDAAVVFAVTLDRAASGTVTVDYATADGTATAGADYAAARGMLTFGPGETEKALSVTLLDDAHDEGEETFMLRLYNARGAHIADGEGTGTIENSDPLPRAWLARFGRTVAGHVVEAVGARLKGGGPHLAIGGWRLALGPGAAGVRGRESRTGAGQRAWDSRVPDSWDDPMENGPRNVFRSLTDRELLLRSSFQIGLGDDGAGARWTAWGRASSSRFDANADDLALDGDVNTFMLGADAERERWLGGLALAYSTGEGGFRDQAARDGRPDRGSGRLESMLTSVHPWLAYEVDPGLSVWGIVGAGRGKVTLSLEGDGSWRSDTAMRMGALGARGVLVPAGGTDGFELVVRTDALLMRITSEAGRLAASEADTSRLRLILEGSRAFALASGGTLTPSLELGLRHDGGDAETGTGFEVGGGLSYADPVGGLTFEGSARALVAHEDVDYREWGVSGSLRVDPGSSGRGLSLTLATTLGAASSGVEQLWSLRDARDLARDRAFEPAGPRVEAQVGYGLNALSGSGVLTPYAGLELAEAGERAWRLGASWKMAPESTLSLEGSRRESANGSAPIHELMLRASLRW